MLDVEKLKFDDRGLIPAIVVDDETPADQKRTLVALGLRKISQVVEHEDNPTLRGMIKKVHHLVTVIE